MNKAWPRSFRDMHDHALVFKPLRTKSDGYQGPMKPTMIPHRRGETFGFGLLRPRQFGPGVLGAVFHI